MREQAATGLAALNRLDDVTLARQLHRCCGSAAWVQGMLAARPFRTPFDLRDAADRVWQSLLPTDWVEAFAAHPRIGERFASGWSADEQAAARGTRGETLEELAAANRAYEARFGHLFVVCATGKTTEEMLAMLRNRLDNDVETELAIAAEEQRKITRLRLDKLLAEFADRDEAPPEARGTARAPRPEARGTMISTHVLDTSQGRPADGVAVTLERQDASGWRVVARGVTDRDGRVKELASGETRAPGTFRLTFDTGPYFSARGVRTFYPSVSVSFEVRDAAEHHHVPLLVSPFGYSTYRGS